MNLKTISLGITGFGAVLFLFAVVMWMANKPDFYQGLAMCKSMGSETSQGYKTCASMVQPVADEASAAYKNCLFGTKYQVCATVTGVPYLSIGGILLILVGGGLFVFSRKTRAVA